MDTVKGFDAVAVGKREVQKNNFKRLFIQQPERLFNLGSRDDLIGGVADFLQAFLRISTSSGSSSTRRIRIVWISSKNDEGSGCMGFISNSS